VFATCRIDLSALAETERWAASHGGLVALFWHEDIYALPYACERAGIRGRALVGHGDAGDLFAALLERSGHVAIRGGSSRRASRRAPSVVRQLIADLRTAPGAILALAVDGTHGPAHELKLGGPLIARETRRPVALVHLAASRSLRLPTWDRLAIPLPTGSLRCYVEGPHFAPASASDPAGLELWRAELETRLLALRARSYSDFGLEPPASFARIVRCSRVE
jgi:3-deoxy-D-manno-octulosonic-acid transferase